MHLDVDSAVNMFSAQKKIERAFDRYRLIIVPESLTDFKVSPEPTRWWFRILASTLASNNDPHGPGNRVLKPWVLLYAGAYFGSYLESSDDQYQHPKCCWLAYQICRS